MRTKIKIGGIAAFILAISLLVAPAFAEEHNMQTGETHKTVEQTQQTTTTEKSKLATEHTMLDAAKLRVCNERQNTIHTIMERSVTRAEKQLQLFSSIAEHTETFYTKKGKTLDTYATLVADVNAKKATAQAVLDELKATPMTFNCEAHDPKGIAQTFKDHLKIVNEALKSYKTAVKNLIVGVKSVQGTTNRDKTTQGGQQ